MKKVFIIAGHELRATIATRAFWIQLLIVPLVGIGFGSISRFAAQQQATVVYTIVDQSDAVAQPLVEILDRPQVGLPQGFGTQPPAANVRVPLMPEIDPHQETQALSDALLPYLNGKAKVATAQGAQTLGAAVVVPAGFGSAPGKPVEILSTRPVPQAFSQQVRNALSDMMRTRALADRGVDPQLVAQVNRIVAPVQVVNPAQRNAQRDMRAEIARTVAPIAFSVLLAVAVLTAGARLLSGVIEERANKLVETILSSVTAGQFMTGKLLGIGVVGIVIILGWLGSALILLRSADGGDAIFKLLTNLMTPGMVAAFVLYFLSAYIMYASIYLTIGSTADSPQDVQAYMGPLTLVAIAPIALLAPMSLAPNGPLAVAMSWIPLYTPYTMMMRLTADPPMWQVVGTTAVMVAFMGLLVWAMSRIFRASILASGASMRPAQLWRVLIGKAG